MKKTLMLVMGFILLSFGTILGANEVQSFQHIKSAEKYVYTMSGDASTITYIFKRKKIQGSMDDFKVQLKTVVNKICSNKEFKDMITSGTKIQYFYIPENPYNTIMLTIDSCK